MLAILSHINRPSKCVPRKPSGLSNKRSEAKKNTKQNKGETSTLDLTFPIVFFRGGLRLRRPEMLQLFLQGRKVAIQALRQGQFTWE